MTAITLFASTFALVFFLGLQSLVVNAGHRWLAFACWGTPRRKSPSASTGASGKW